jgi:hypothetical protein
MKRKKHFDDDDDEILRDGETLRVPLRMMDSWHRDMERHFRDQRDRDRVTDANGDSGLGLLRPGFRLLADADDLNDRRRAAYDKFTLDLENAWQNNPPTGFGSHELRGAQEGDICTINGAPGHLRCGSDGKLVCVPDGGKDATLPSTDRTAARTSYIQRLENLWRSS